MLDEGRKAAEGHPSEDHEAYVDVNVEHWGDAVQDQLTQDATQSPDCAPGIVGCEEGRREGQHQIGDAQVGQINVDGGDGGDAPQENPQRQSIARERGEEEE